jgi:hypothetical protein
MAPCNSCGAALQAHIFPVMYRRPKTGRPGQTLQDGGEAGCFYHPDKRAVIPCSECGRFLCTLCDLELGEKHICPTCLEVGKEKQGHTTIQNSRILYDNIALCISLVPLSIIFWFVSLFTAPAALYLVIRYWNAPLSIIPRSKIRFVFAAALACLQIAAWSALIVAMIT